VHLLSKCQDQVEGLNSGVLKVIPEDGSVGSVGRNRNLEGNPEGTEGHRGWKLEAGKQEQSGLGLSLCARPLQTLVHRVWNWKLEVRAKDCDGSLS
jgi:hypothetical protein